MITTAQQRLQTQESRGCVHHGQGIRLPLQEQSPKPSHLVVPIRPVCVMDRKAAQVRA